MATDREKRNMELMQTLDDAWNNQGWDTFDARHKTDTVVRWPAQPPTHGIHDHRKEGIQMFKTFPDNQVENRPYLTSFATGDWTCSIARFTGTMKGWMTLPNGTRAMPTGRSFALDLRRVARWQGDQILEEYLFYDLAAMLKQLDIDPEGNPRRIPPLFLGALNL